MKLLVAVPSVDWFLFLSLLFWNCNCKIHILIFSISNFSTVLSSQNRIVIVKPSTDSPPTVHVSTCACCFYRAPSHPQLLSASRPSTHTRAPLPAQHPTFASPLSDVSKSTQAVLPHVTMHRRVHRCSPLFSPPSSRAREGTPMSSQSSFPARPTATASVMHAKQPHCECVRGRPASDRQRATSERGRITFHDASKAKERVRPPSLSLSVAPSPSSSME